MSTKNLWGQMPQAEKVRSPLAILRQQASLLGQTTRGLLEGIVTRQRAFDPGRDFSATLSIVAPSLDSYEVQVVEIKYPLACYPLEVSWSEGDTKASDESEFVSVLGQVLSSKRTKTIIGRLLTQIHAELDSSPNPE